MTQQEQLQQAESAQGCVLRKYLASTLLDELKAAYQSLPDEKRNQIKEALTDGCA